MKEENSFYMCTHLSDVLRQRAFEHARKRSFTRAFAALSHTIWMEVNRGTDKPLFGVYKQWKFIGKAIVFI